MNRTDQKTRLSEIIQLANDTIKSMEQKNNDLLLILHEFEELKNSVYELLDDDCIDFDEYMFVIINKFFERELEDLFREVEDFRDDLNSHIDELPETRAERLEEIYIELEQVINSFNQSVQEYENVETAIEHIEESIILLTDMRK